MRPLLLQCLAERSVAVSEPSGIGEPVSLEKYFHGLASSVRIDAQDAANLVAANCVSGGMRDAVDSLRLRDVVSRPPFQYSCIEYGGANRFGNFRAALCLNCGEPGGLLSTLREANARELAPTGVECFESVAEGVASAAVGVLFVQSPGILRGRPSMLGVQLVLGWDGGGVLSGMNVVFRREEGERRFSDAVANLLSESAVVALSAFALFHCKGVELAPQPSDSEQMKWHRRTRVPELKAYKLVVRPSPIRLGESGASGEAGKALHLCRGHFARYTQAAPLFGRHVGQFWIPQHVRGSRALGEVAKTYKPVPG